MIFQGMSLKKIALGMSITFCLAIFLYMGFWGLEKAIDLSTRLHQIDLKVNGPQLTTDIDLRQLREQQNRTQNDLAQIRSFLLLPTDANGRRILSADDARYFLERNHGLWPDDWNSEQAINGVKSVLFTGQGFRLRIPYHTSWGNAAYTIVPYEAPDYGDLTFWTMQASDTGSVYRCRKFLRA